MLTTIILWTSSRAIFCSNELRLGPSFVTYLFPIQGLGHLQLPLLGVNVEVPELVPSYQAVGDSTI